MLNNCPPEGPGPEFGDLPMGGIAHTPYAPDAPNRFGAESYSLTIPEVMRVIAESKRRGRVPFAETGL